MRLATCVFPQRELSDEERARAEMCAFDELEPQGRAAFREALHNFSVPDVVGLIKDRGVSPAVREALQRRGLLPYQVDECELIAETVRQLDARHTDPARAPAKASNG